MKENTRRKALEQQYEQAAFALLLDDLMAEEGAALLRETDGTASADVPPEADGRCMKTLRRADAKARRGQVLRFAGKAISRVAVVFLVVAITFSVPFCTVSAFRAASLNLIYDTFDKGTVISPDITSGKRDNAAKSPSWFPSGIWKTVFLTNEENIYVIRFEDSDANVIFYSEMPADGSTVSIDSEGAILQSDVLVNGCSALMAVKESQIILAWLDSANSLICTLEVHGPQDSFTPDIAIRIAESIK